MQSDIYSKLQSHLSRNSFEESDVVYILSRIRKILELEESQQEHKELRFFCNWSLHVQIEDARSVTNLLKRILDGEPTFKIYDLFLSELKKFLDKHHLQSSIFESETIKWNFLNKLAEVYKDTPIMVKDGKKKLFTVTFTEPDIGIKVVSGIPTRSMGGVFRIEY